MVKKTLKVNVFKETRDEVIKYKNNQRFWYIDAICSVLHTDIEYDRQVLPVCEVVLYRNHIQREKKAFTVIFKKTNNSVIYATPDTSARLVAFRPMIRTTPGHIQIKFKKKLTNFKCFI